jgi:hypothetical protein
MTALVSNGTASLRRLFQQFIIVVVFSIAFAYIEAAVVVYLRKIFHPGGFTFPLVEFNTTPFWQKHLLIEIGREAATLVLMFTAALLFGFSRRQRFAYFLAIFAVWDIFYYVWLKILINWPASIFDWDVLFLIPVPWASAVLAPVLVSLTLLVFAIVILYRDCTDKTIKVTLMDWAGFSLTGLAVVISFCIAGLNIQQPDYKTHFYWPLFVIGELTALFLFTNCLAKSK